jgi:GntR family transcriptional regulator
LVWNIESDRPVYVQLVEQIKRKIVAGEYKAGDRVPSVRELAGSAAVNPNTMQKALAELERVGLMYSQRTSGRFITEDEKMINDLKKEIALEQIDTFIGNMVAMGIGKSEILELFKARIEEM